MTAFAIRKATRPEDLARIERLVSSVVRECYGHLLRGYFFDAEEDWPNSWIAEIGAEIAGVMLSGREWIEDLWIAQPHRRLGIGAKLLRIGEREIAGRGHAQGKLRVVAENLPARCFYARHGWIESRSYPHETCGFEMVEMAKNLEQQPTRKG